MTQETKPTFEVSEMTLHDIDEATAMRLRSWLDTYPSTKHGITREWVETRNAEQCSPERSTRRKKNFEERKAKGTGAGWVARDFSGKVIGAVTPVIEDDGSQRLGSLYVDKAWHGKGVGGALMQKALDWFDKSKPVLLEVADYNERAKAFYRKWGFEEIPGSETLFNDTIPEVKMVRQSTVSIGLGEYGENQQSVKVVFVRHGQTNMNIAMSKGNDVIEGDDPLNDTGLQQAKETRDKLKDRHFDAIVSSPLIRALKTAEIINEYHNLTIQIDNDLRERSVGGLDEGKWHEMFDIDLNLQPKNAGGEDMKSFFVRTYRAIEGLIDTYAGKTILVVAHGGVHHAFYAYHDQLPWKGNMRISRLENAGVREYELVKHSSKENENEI